MPISLQRKRHPERAREIVKRPCAAPAAPSARAIRRIASGAAAACRRRRAAARSRASPRAADRRCRRARGRACGAAPCRRRRGTCRTARRHTAPRCAPRCRSAFCDDRRQARGKRPNALLRHQRDDRVAVARIKRLDRMRHRIHPAGRRQPRRQRQRQLDVVDHRLRQDLRRCVWVFFAPVAASRRGSASSPSRHRWSGSRAAARRCAARSPCRGRWSSRRRSRRRRRPRAPSRTPWRVRSPRPACASRPRKNPRQALAQHGCIRRRPAFPDWPSTGSARAKCSRRRVSAVKLAKQCQLQTGTRIGADLVGEALPSFHPRSMGLGRGMMPPAARIANHFQMQ